MIYKNQKKYIERNIFVVSMCLTQLEKLAKHRQSASVNRIQSQVTNVTTQISELQNYSWQTLKPHLASIWQVYSKPKQAL